MLLSWGRVASFGRSTHIHRHTAGAARLLQAGEVNQTVVEMARGLMFVMTISDGSCLAALAAPSCDVGLVGYEMALLVMRAGDVLTPQLRAELQAALPR